MHVFEHVNMRCNARIIFGVPVESVRAANLMEENRSDSLPLEDSGIELNLKPFEIETLIIELAK